MQSLYGIETYAGCRAHMDELLRLHESARDKATIGALKARLREYFRNGNTEKGQHQMSSIERQYFWPAIHRAYVGAPNLSSRETWTDGLSEIEYNLNRYRPEEFD